MEPEFALEEKHWGCISGGQTKAILEGWMALYSVLNVQLAAYSRVMDDQWHTSWSAIQHTRGKGMRRGHIGAFVQYNLYYRGNCTIQLILQGVSESSALGAFIQLKGQRG